MHKEYYTYVHCKPDWTPFYVGKGCGKRSHVFNATRNQHHKNIVAKYGRENIIIVVFPCSTDDQAKYDEVQLIKHLRGAGYDLCNQTAGGEGAQGYKHTAESLALMSKLKKGKASPNKGVPMSEEVKLKLSSARKGKNLGNTNCVGRIPWNKGMRGVVKLSAETRAKISKSNMGRKPSDEAVRKLVQRSLGNTIARGRIHTAESIARMSAVHKLRHENARKGIGAAYPTTKPAKGTK